MTKKHNKNYADWQALDPEFNKEGTRYDNPIPSRTFIQQTLREHRAKALTLGQLAQLFVLTQSQKDNLDNRLAAMVRDHQLRKVKAGKFAVAEHETRVTGKVIAHAEGYGFLVPDSGEEDHFIAPPQMKRVMHGDRVDAFIKTQSGKSEAIILNITERAVDVIVGKLSFQNHAKFGDEVQVIPENRRIRQTVIVTNADAFSVTDGIVVKVKVTEYPSQYRPISAEIVEVMGDRSDPGIEIDIAIESHGLPSEWNAAVRHETDLIPDVVSEADMAGRVDLRNLPLVTIDGITARDFDDAVYAKKTSNGYKLYVAIADVSHYVRTGAPLDKEAELRGTSVYFPNRVIPMLPEKLSNGLCSLNPDVDRLCMVCEMVYDETGKLIRSRFYEAVMHSHARLTYETVEAMLFRSNKSIQKQNKALYKDLSVLKSLFLKQRKHRNQRGAINFRTTEPEFEYNAAGKIEHIHAKQSLKSHQLIEECMVAANVCAAKFVLKHKGRALFRNHEGPNEEKMEALVATLARLGIKLQGTVESITPKQIAEVVEQIQMRDDFFAIQMSILRSMKQAVYQPDNLGHFGLALGAYSHFTSPIRRYPDLLLHRAIKHILRKEPREMFAYDTDDMDRLGEHCSMTERRADDAVYDVIGYLKCEYMHDKVGDTFDVLVSSVTSFGLFVTIKNEFVDGLVHISNLGKDYFDYDERLNELVCERSGVRYRVGDEMVVKLVKVDMEERKIDFIPVSSMKPKPRASKPSTPSIEPTKRPAHEKKGRKTKKVTKKKSRRRSNAKSRKD